MEEFKKAQAFNDAFPSDTLWKPFNRTAKAYMHAGTSGSGVRIDFEMRNGEDNPPSLPLEVFLRENEMQESDFYNPSPSSV